MNSYPWPVERHILLVEDDALIGRSLDQALASQGYRVSLAADAVAARAALDRDPVDLVLLDLGLPDTDGLDLLRELRADGLTTPVVALTARQQEADIVLGLDAGANDYVTKPFRLAELLARIRTQLREGGIRHTADALELGDLRINVDARQVFVGNVEINLRPREFDLLVLLVGEAGHVVRRERIMAEVWDEHWYGSTKTLDVHVSALRRKLNVTQDVPVLQITALPRVGYRAELP